MKVSAPPFTVTGLVLPRRSVAAVVEFVLELSRDSVAE